jgi:hypothetical protein
VISAEFEAGGCQNSGLSITGTGTLNDIYGIANGFGQGDCIEVLDLNGDLDGAGPGSHGQVNGYLEFDLDTLEGLSTDAGGPCVTVNE